MAWVVEAWKAPYLNEAEKHDGLIVPGLLREATFAWED